MFSYIGLHLKWLLIWLRPDPLDAERTFGSETVFFPIIRDSIDNTLKRLRPTFSTGKLPSIKGVICHIVLPMESLMIGKNTVSEQTVHSASSGSGRSHMRSYFECWLMKLNISQSSTIHGPNIGLWVIPRVVVKIIKALSMKWKFVCRLKCVIWIIVTIKPCYELKVFFSIILCSNRSPKKLPAHAWYKAVLSLLYSLSIFPYLCLSLFVFRTSTSRTHESILMIGGFNSAFWQRKMPCGYANEGKYTQESMTSKPSSVWPGWAVADPGFVDGGRSNKFVQWPRNADRYTLNKSENTSGVEPGIFELAEMPVTFFSLFQWRPDPALIKYINYCILPLDPIVWNYFFTWKKLTQGRWGAWPGWPSWIL